MADFNKSTIFAGPVIFGREGNYTAFDELGNVEQVGASGIVGGATPGTPDNGSVTIGNAGDLKFDADYLYVCIDGDPNYVWKRVALSALPPM